MRIMAASFLKIILACINIIVGIVCALFILEVTLHITPLLVFNGSAPSGPALTITSYDVRYSDGDAFYWSHGLIKLLTPNEDGIEARVNFQTDEFGFHNDPPLPATVDIAVVGRSYSMGAETTMAWPERLSQQTGLKVLNLAQIGSGNDVKLHFLQNYGFLRHPHWIIVEVLPWLDIVEYTHSSPLLIQQIPTFIIQNGWERLHPAEASIPIDSNIVYPLPVQINGHTYKVTFAIPELSVLTASKNMIQQSKQWQMFHADLDALVVDARAHSSCVALLYAPSKADAYLPLLQDSAGLTAIRQAIDVYSLNSAGFLEQGKPQAIDLNRLQTDADDMRSLIENLAHDEGVRLIDPIDKMTASLQAGQDPFMAYDAHLSPVGHQLVAQQAAEVLNSQVLNESSCN